MYTRIIMLKVSILQYKLIYFYLKVHFEFKHRGHPASLFARLEAVTRCVIPPRGPPPVPWPSYARGSLSTLPPPPFPTFPRAAHYLAHWAFQRAKFMFRLPLSSLKPGFSPLPAAPTAGPHAVGNSRHRWDRGGESDPVGRAETPVRKQRPRSGECVPPVQIDRCPSGEPGPPREPLPVSEGSQGQRQAGDTRPSEPAPRGTDAARGGGCREKVN